MLDEPMKKKRILNKKGFTLIETIVAFVIIAIILVVALVGFNTIAGTSNRAQTWNSADEALENFIASKDINPENIVTNLPVTLKVPSVKGGKVEIEGSVITYTDKASGKTMTVFVLGKH